MSREAKSVTVKISALRGRHERSNGNKRSKLTSKSRDKIKNPQKTPGVHEARRAENPAPSPLIRKVQANAKNLLKDRYKDSILTRMPVYTSLHNKGPFEVIRPELKTPPKPEWVAIPKEDVSNRPDKPRPRKYEDQRANVQRQFERGREAAWTIQKLWEWKYALTQLYLYIIYWCASWFGASTKTDGIWKNLAFRYPPTQRGWDLFNIRTKHDALARSNEIYIKKKVWFNPSTGRYETVTFTDQDDESLYRDRYPGETDGMDPTEFAKYHYLSPEDTTVKLLSERFIKPIMTIFVAFMLSLALVNGSKIVISVGHLYIFEYPDRALFLGLILVLGVILWKFF